MIRHCVATFTLLLYAAAGWTGQLTPSLDSGQLTVLIEATEWPATLRKDLTSGLTNRILIRVRLARGAEIVQQRAVEIAIRYDLWDERFTMNVTLDGVAAEARTIRNAEEMQAALRKLRLPPLFAGDGVAAAQAHTVTAEILLNPVDRERMEMIKKWVAENSIPPADIGGRTAGGALSVTLFNRIFEQYAKGADLAAVWQETSTSRPFRLQELTDESR
ncbi:hypothetical protein [Peristeroidobacter agariperforans]|uniref:hypothetical protein n=1 Tax=Peristeroidobacter agariperforans TaxID=268404 RepID=UPI00101CE377|nr:hypothetical protein [Peristeroidobacter agariperforans]